MELLSQPKTVYLLEAGLEVQHAQSHEWLNEIEFWRDELAFFYALIVKKTLKSLPIDAKNLIEKIETELILLGSSDLDELQKDIEHHEVFLNDLLESKYLKEENYRIQHEQLMLKVYHFERRFKELKRDIFKLVEQIDKTK